MVSIITHLLLYIQYLHKQIFELLLFISKYIPLKQWAFDDSHSPEYQKFKIDKLPKIFMPDPIDYQLLLAYYQHKYGKILKPVNHRSDNPIPETTLCPRCGAPHDYIYKNNGSKGQCLCKVCNERFNESNIYNRPMAFRCPYCGHILVNKKDRKHFHIHKCINPNCSYYLHNLSKLPKDLADSDKHKYKLHYIYREFFVDFFKMDLHDLPSNAINFNFKKFNAHIMGLCLTYHINLKLSTRQTAHALDEVHGIKISHSMVASYAMTAATVIKPFTDTFDYKPSNILSADETYIKMKGIRHYVWLIMDACKKSVIGYQVSDTRAVGPCILAMRMAFEKFKSFPGKALKFIADGYSAYPLASQQCKLVNGWDFDVTQVIGLTNDDAVSTEFRWVKQIVERLNRTFKFSYRGSCGYGSPNGALYGVSLWVAYYNFLRPHPYTYWRPLNELSAFSGVDNMPAKWQILIRLGQQTILNMQNTQSS
ncbi:MAG: DDE-type integrase/transposase/recombinase [Ignavibacteriaceae bacterium]|nr:DDE-type integrase/transposase/recombinase [Ignavibacteriaceae bacterium]